MTTDYGTAHGIGAQKQQRIGQAVQVACGSRKVEVIVREIAEAKGGFSGELEARLEIRSQRDEKGHFANSRRGVTVSWHNAETIVGEVAVRVAPPPAVNNSFSTVMLEYLAPQGVAYTLGGAEPYRALASAEKSQATARRRHR